MKPAVVHAAEREIAAILARLERETGGLVHGLAVSAIDVSAVYAPARNVLMAVLIDMEPPQPLVHSWGTDAG